MDDELKELEAELQRLRPTAPSRRVTARLEVELAAAVVKAPVSRLHWWWAAALPAAAAITLALVYFSAHRLGRSSPGVSDENVAAAPASATRATSAEAALKPIAAENVLISASDEGLVTLDDGTPARRERLRFVDTITWRNPRTNASLTWSVPREEIRVVPVVFQ